MKTNLGIDLTDEQRARIARNLGLKHKSATRNDIKEAVNDYVQNTLAADKAIESKPSGEAQEVVGNQSNISGHPQVPAFVPSRGDESYLYTGKDQEITDACRKILDGVDFIKDFAWETLERNRA